MNIFLCGFMGCGKSALGKVLSKILQRELIDTDEYIVKKYKMSIPQIFENFGEETFRNYETKTLSELRGRDCIVSCGGGMMLREKNAETAKTSGKVIYLNQTFEICYSRIKDDGNRPIVQNNTKEGLESIYKKRAEIYKKNCDIEVIPGNTPEETAKKVLNLLRF